SIEKASELAPRNSECRNLVRLHEGVLNKTIRLVGNRAAPSHSSAGSAPRGDSAQLRARRCEPRYVALLRRQHDRGIALAGSAGCYLPRRSILGSLRRLSRYGRGTERPRCGFPRSFRRDRGFPWRRYGEVAQPPQKSANNDQRLWVRRPSPLCPKNRERLSRYARANMRFCACNCRGNADYRAASSCGDLICCL